MRCERAQNPATTGLAVVDAGTDFTELLKGLIHTGMYLARQVGDLTGRTPTEVYAELGRLLGIDEPADP